MLTTIRNLHMCVCNPTSHFLKIFNGSIVFTAVYIFGTLSLNYNSLSNLRSANTRDDRSKATMDSFMALTNTSPTSACVNSFFQAPLRRTRLILQWKALNDERPTSFNSRINNFSLWNFSERQKFRQNNFFLNIDRSFLLKFDFAIIVRPRITAQTVFPLPQLYLIINLIQQIIFIIHRLFSAA